MQARPPPRKVILWPSEPRHPTRHDSATHKFEYTPGILASVTAAGRGASQRSGFHSYASSPQRVLLRLQFKRPATTVVFFGTRISWIGDPSTPVMGFDNGRMTSLCVLDALYQPERPGSKRGDALAENLRKRCVAA